jgi:hypothetical protein
MRKSVLSLPGTVTPGSDVGGFEPFVPDRPSNKVYSLPVPERLKGHSVPADIGAFINDLRPHMKMCLSHMHVPADQVDEYISDYVAYQLDTDKTGVKRYTTYDPVKHPNIPYYKWFLSILKYRKKYYHSKLAPNNKFVDISSMETEGRSIGLDRNFSLGGGYLDGMFAYFPDHDNRLSLLQVVEEVRQFSLSHWNWDRRSFRRNAWQFLAYRYQGYKNVEIAEFCKVSPSAVTQWGTMLVDLVKGMFPGLDIRLP